MNPHPPEMIGLKQLTTKYIVDIETFESAKKGYYTYCRQIENPDYSPDKASQAFETLCQKFEHILRICGSEANVTEGVNTFLGEQKRFIPNASLQTCSTEFNFTFGLFREFYLVTELKNPHNLKHMKDDFWHLLFKLADIGKFGFKENEKPSSTMRSKYPQLFNKQGNYYKLLRNYFLYEMDHGLIRSLGYVSVSWPNQTPFGKLIPKACEAFRLMYEINLLLWRPDNKSTKLKS